MIINNNTKDVDYLGRYTKEEMVECNIRVVSKNVCGRPFHCHLTLRDILLFDCNGCRYGFRIKQLKTKLNRDYERKRRK